MRHLAIALAALLAVTVVGRAQPPVYLFHVRVSDAEPILTTHGGGPIHLEYSQPNYHTHQIDHGSGMALFGGGGGSATAGYKNVFGSVWFFPKPDGPAVDFAFVATLGTTVTVTDPDSGLSATTPMAFNLGGKTGPEGTTYWAAGATMGLVELGGHTYRFALEDVEFDAQAPVILNMNVFYDEGHAEPGTGPEPQQLPEPSSFALLALGGLGLLGWHHRRCPS